MKIVQSLIAIGMLGSFIITDQGSVSQYQIGDRTYYNTEAGNSYHEYKIGERTYLQGSDGSSYTGYSIGKQEYLQQTSPALNKPTRVLGSDNDDDTESLNLNQE